MAFTAGLHPIRCMACHEMVAAYDWHDCKATRDAITAQQEKVADLRGKLGRMRAKIRTAHRLLLAHEHASPSPGYPLEALELLRDALEDDR